MSRIYNINNETMKKIDIDINDVALKFMSIPKDKNAKMIIDNFEIIFGIQNKIPLFMILENKETISTGIITTNEYVKKKVIEKITEELYDKKIIEEYKSLPINTVTYTTGKNLEIIENLILTFLQILNNAEIR